MIVLFLFLVAWMAVLFSWVALLVLGALPVLGTAVYMVVWVAVLVSWPFCFATAVVLVQICNFF